MYEPKNIIIILILLFFALFWLQIHQRKSSVKEFHIEKKEEN